MNEARSTLHAAWLAAIGEQGWRKASVEDVAAATGMTADAARRLGGDRIDMLVALQDRVAAEAAAGAAEAGGSVRDRLFDGLMRGFDALQANRAAVLAIWRSRDPGVALLLGGRGGLHVRALAQAAGVEVSGARGRLRIAALGALCLQAFRGWAADESADMSATMAELDRLLERAEKAELEGVTPDLIGLPGLTSLLSRLPFGRRRGNGDPVPPPSPDPQAG